MQLCIQLTCQVEKKSCIPQDSKKRQVRKKNEEWRGGRGGGDVLKGGGKEKEEGVKIKRAHHCLNHWSMVLQDFSPLLDNHL